MATARPATNMSAAEWEARQQLAACYRIFDHMGWSELIYNHITLRVPDEAGAFLINPFGLLYSEVTASNLVKIDIDGHVRDGSPYPVNRAGFTQHSVFHRHLPDAHCVIHTHTTPGKDCGPPTFTRQPLRGGSPIMILKGSPCGPKRASG